MPTACWYSDPTPGSSSAQARAGSRRPISYAGRRQIERARTHPPARSPKRQNTDIGIASCDHSGGARTHKLPAPTFSTTPRPFHRGTTAADSVGGQSNVDNDFDRGAHLQRAHERPVWLDAPLALRHRQRPANPCQRDPRGAVTSLAIRSIYRRGQLSRWPGHRVRELRDLQD